VRNSILHHLKGLQSSLDYNDDKINHDNNHDHQDNEDEANS